MSKYQLIIFCFSMVLFYTGCKEKKANDSFINEVSAEVGLVFNNSLEYTEEFNPYTYRNFYNGGGVALGDINNDGLLDVYFTGNVVDNKLFLNKGNWKFEDITQSAGVTCAGVWSSGATFADINGDGLLDLYVCKSGKPGGDNRHNELFINNGDLTFKESSKAYGLDIMGLSTHAAFFDYDKDGDLDCYVLNNSIRSVGGYDIIEGQREIPDPDNGGNKFLRNDDGKFVDVTLDQGIYSSNIGFGLGITLSDFNGDGWTDIFVSNDFFERDYLYINDSGKGFKESLDQYFNSITLGSMGADAADLNNDGWQDIFVTEMLPNSIARKRTKAVFESWDKYALNVSKGYHHQFPRNVLQRNINGDKFAEIGRFADVAATDWSWGALLFDIDNDGLKDIFVANGIYKDLLDRDYLAFMANDEEVKKILNKKGKVIKDLIDLMPSSTFSNFVFRNNGDFRFENVAKEWGLDATSYSNGSSYGDLDNNGTLDLVVNNVNMPSFVFRNNIDTAKNKSIRIKLKGAAKNTSGIGAKIYAYSGDKIFSVENYPSRGFESSVDHILHLGLGEVGLLDSLVVYWQMGGVSKLVGVRANQLLTLKESESQLRLPSKMHNQYAHPLLQEVDLGIDFKHQENNFVDFDRNRLLMEMAHNEGPSLAVGDVNGDGLEDFYVGGAHKQSGRLYVQTPIGSFLRSNDQLFEASANSEDVDAQFFDCDNDGDLDLYVASGGKEFSTSSEYLNDRLYINDGRGNFIMENQRLPFLSYFSSSTVQVADFNNDGYQDIFVGERFHPFYYINSVRGYLLQNDGKGYFSDVTEAMLPQLVETEMITDARWADINNDGWNDLIVSSEWGTIKLLENNEGVFSDSSVKWGLSDKVGLWKSLMVADIDGDGDLDVFAGNLGRNSFLKDSVRLYVNDFDQNGTSDYLFCEPSNGKWYTIADRDELVAQIPSLKKNILYYKNYENKSIDSILSETQLSKAKVITATVLESVVLINQNGSFEMHSLPAELQYGPIYAMNAIDLNKDGIGDFIFGGNQHLVKPKYGRYDALSLSILMGRGDAIINNVMLSPWFDEVRSIQKIKIGQKEGILVGNNNSHIKYYEKKN